HAAVAPREDLGASATTRPVTGRGCGRGDVAGDLHHLPQEAFAMLLALAILIAIAWLLGFTVFHVASGAIHVLIVIAIIVAVVHFVQGRRAPL
ncbi:MAG TPA: lmo0937 family membrane protein, partial [Kofleriaceae bacterium]|nr:lmo0937 family membrane protein [Kofleriaceae bacterium]